MATSDRGTRGNFFNSRGNVLGMILAITVILVHLVFGIGFLWPVVALATWGAAVALIPDGGGRADALESGSRNSMEPRELEAKLSRQREHLGRGKGAAPVVRELQAGEDSLRAILREWDHLNDFPEQQVVVSCIIEDYLPAVIDSYLQVPESARERAVPPTVDSLKMLWQEAERIRAAIGEDNVRALENHREMLRMQFGNAPEFRTDPARDLGEPQGPGQSGSDRQVR